MKNVFTQEKVSFNLVIYKKFGKNFELVVDPDVAVEYKQKNNLELEEVVKAQKIFSDAKKGELANESDILQVFNTNNFSEVAKIILKQGEIQLTSEHREKLRQEKFKQIVQQIHRLAIDPRSGLPHPVIRIENALSQAKIKIDEYAKIEDQVQNIITKINHILPLKVEQKTIDIKIPVNYAAKLQGFLLNQGKIMSEQWLSDGSYECKIKIPAGMRMILIDEINSKTKGCAEIKLID